MITSTILGIHHITAITADAQQNVDFYTGILGLRLVKITVNYDDPGSYHLYYGDELGRPGSILTFFVWPGGYRGNQGTGQVTTTSFSAPKESLGFWKERLKERQIAWEEAASRFDDEAILFHDPDGMEIELVAGKIADPRVAWNGGPIPVEMAIRGLYGATLSEEGYERTSQLLTETLGFRRVGAADNRVRYEADAGGPGAIIDLLCLPGGRRGKGAVGVVHHIAWRTPDDKEQIGWHGDLVQIGYNISPVMDRQYFRSIYFREPGGVLFEIATDLPGFTTDETAESLGSELKLPPSMEPSRAQILKRLTPLRLPGKL